MHSQIPPIAHRDIKPENILYGADKKWKLCDFGSCIVIQNTEVTNENRTLFEEDIRRQTTKIYRAPEQIDLNSRFPINEKVDIFALGCLIYQMLFFRFPFELERPIDHFNARYVLPNNFNLSIGMRDILTRTLTQDPT